MIDSNAPDLAHHRLSFLAEASHILASSLDVAVTLQQAARLTIPSLADACVMYLVDADGGAQATAVAHAQPEDEAALWELQRRYPDPAGSRGALGRVLASGESVCFPDSDPVARLARARDPLHRSLLERLNTNSAMIVAMVARGQVIGALSLMTSISGRRYTDEDVRFAEDLARRCALAVDNARLYEGAQREIAERKRAEAAVAELAQAKEELVSMISHELRSPAAVLIGYAELLARDNVSEAERHEIATAMVQQGRQLSKLVDDFLDAQRSWRGGKLSVDPKPTDLRPLLDRAAMTARAHASHSFQLDCPATDLIVQADEVRVEQAISNLLSNARKYSPHGGTIRLAVTRRDDDRCVELSVTDQGLGIPADALPHVFDKFYRVDTEDRRTIAGTGLGLAVVRELIEAQGGRIGVDSAGRGQGSRFWFTLPLAAPEAPAAHTPAAPSHRAAPAPAEAPRAARSAAAPGGLRILAVDDEPAIGTMLRRVLRADGHTLDYAASAAEAIARLAAGAYDVVISDLGLGAGDDGLSLAETVRRDWPDVRFILASGSVTVEAASAHERGVHALLQKPYQLSDLRTALRSAA